jgi:hypothetical protein
MQIPARIYFYSRYLRRPCVQRCWSWERSWLQLQSVVQEWYGLGANVACIYGLQTLLLILRNQLR